MSCPASGFCPADELDPDDLTGKPIAENRLALAWIWKGEIEELEREITAITEAKRLEAEDLTADRQETLRQLKESYEQAIAAAVKESHFREGRFSLINTARVSRPVNVRKFEECLPAVFPEVAEITIRKERAVEAIMRVLGLPKSSATRELDKVCDEIPGKPVWTLNAEMLKGGDV